MRGWSAIRAELVAELGEPPEGIPCAHPAVQSAILRAVAEGDLVPWTWHPVVSTDGVHVATWIVAGDALRVGTPGDSVRPCVSQQTLQGCADLLGLVCASPMLLALTQAQATIALDVNGTTLPGRRYDGKIGTDLTRPITQTLAACEEESERVDALIGGRAGLVGPTGKGWTVIRILAHLDQLEQRAAALGQHYWGEETGCNCGFFTRIGGKPTTPPTSWNWIQGPGTAHDYRHTDYSQRGERFLAPVVRVTGGAYGSLGALLTAEQVATSPELAGLVHADGQPASLHHPWLPVCVSLDEGGTCGGGAMPPSPPSPPTPPAPPVVTSGWKRVAPLAAVGGIAAVAAAWRLR